MTTTLQTEFAPSTNPVMDGKPAETTWVADFFRPVRDSSGFHVLPENFREVILARGSKGISELALVAEGPYSIL